MSELPKSVYIHERRRDVEVALVLQMDDSLLATAIYLALVSLQLDFFIMMDSDLSFFFDRVAEIYQRLSAIVANSQSMQGGE